MKQKRSLSLNNSKLFILLLFFTFFPIFTNSAGNSGANFLIWDIGAAPSAMGGAYTSVAQSIYSIHYNPAGIGQLNDQLIGFSHLQLFSDTTMENLIYLFPNVFKGFFGIGILYSSTKFDWYDLYGNKSALNIYNAALSLTYGKVLLKHSSIGITIKGFKRQFDDVSSQGYGIDIGFLTHLFKKKLNLGIALQNLGNQTAFYETSDPMPLTLKVGISYNLFLSQNTSIIFSGDLSNNLKEKPNETNEILGLEFNLFKILSLRAGYNFQNENNHITTGIGIKLFAFTLDYAYTYNEFLGNIHYLTFILNPKALFIKKEKHKDKNTKRKNSQNDLSKTINKTKEKVKIKKEVTVKNETTKKVPLQKKNINKEIIKKEKVNLKEPVMGNTKTMIFYKINQYKLNRNNIIKLRYLVKLLDNFSYKYIIIKGYSDILGEKLYNLTLSKKRAERVKVLLLKYGIDKEKIIVEAYGIKEPIGNNSTEIGREKNRRCEIIIKY